MGALCVYKGYQYLHGKDYRRIDGQGSRSVGGSVWCTGGKLPICSVAPHIEILHSVCFMRLQSLP